jgi:hypothetical protein
VAAAVPRVRRLCGARGRGADALRGPPGAGPAGPRTPADPPAARYASPLQPPTPKVTSTRDARFLPLLSRSHVFDFAGAAPRVSFFSFK